jgi:hypothetical protein
MALEVETAFYREHRDEYHRKYYNKFLVISGNKLWKTFSNESDAVDYAVEQFPVEEFMIHSPAGEDKKTVAQPWVASRRYTEPASPHA